MRNPNPPFNGMLYALYFIAGVVLACVAIAIRITDRTGAGDLPGDFLAIGYTSIIGLVIGLLTYFLVRNEDARNRVVYALWIFLRYFLALVFLGYGFIKVVGLQFVNRLTTLDARVLDLSKNNMTVAWFFYGHSDTYEMFLGLGETVAALLLLFRRTSLLGAFILFTIVVNVVVLNYLFDINVKLNSTCYMLMTLWVLLYQLPRVLDFFVREKATEAPVYPVFSFSDSTRKLISVGNVLIIVAMIGIQSWENFYRIPRQFGLDKTYALKGVWKVNELDTQLKDSLWTRDLGRAKIYFDRYGQGFIKDKLTILSMFRYTEESDSVKFSQMTYDSTYNFRGTFKKDDNRLELTGEWSGIPTRIVMTEAPEYNLENREIAEQEVPMTASELNRFVGKYKVSMGSTVSMALKDNKLYRISSTAADVEMIHLGDNRFVYKGRPSYWQFTFSDKGEIVDIIYSNFGNDYRAWRVE